jgi:hypothetical protein
MTTHDHTLENPNVYIQNSHSCETNVLLKVPKDCLLILSSYAGNSCSNNENSLIKAYDTNLSFFKGKKEEKKEEEEGQEEQEYLENLRDKLHTAGYRIIHFHYSDYFGIKPPNINTLRTGSLGITESYYDFEYSKNAYFNKNSNPSETIKVGLMEISQFKACSPETPEYYDTLEWFEYHRANKLLNVLVDRDEGVGEIGKINTKIQEYNQNNENPIIELNNNSLIPNSLFNTNTDQMKALIIGELKDIAGSGINLSN